MSILRLLFLPIVLSSAASLHAQCANLATPGLNGCGASTPFGIPTIACSGTPFIGNAAFAVDANVPCQTTSPPLLIVGTCLPSPALIRAPFGPNGFCGPSMAPCLVFVGPTIFAQVPGTNLGSPSTFRFSLPIPNDPILQGGTVCAQSANLCVGAGGSCIGASQGISITVL